MNVEDLIKLWKEYEDWESDMNTKTFERFMLYVQKKYWLNKPMSKGGGQ